MSVCSMSEDALCLLWKMLNEKEASCGRVEAFFFDLDGTLSDTMSVHYEAYRRTLARYGGCLQCDDFFHIVGPPARITIPLFMEASNLGVPSVRIIEKIHSEKKAEFEKILAKESVTGLPALEVLRACADKKAIAVVTSGNRRGAEAILQALGIRMLVDVLVSSDDVKNGKPNGEPYAKAVAKLGVESDFSLAFEDNESGIRSALEAGLSVIDVKRLMLIEPDAAK